MAPRKSIRLLPHPDQRQPHQRRPLQLEAAAVLLQELLPAQFLLLRRKPPPVVLPPGQFHSLPDHLLRPLQLLPDEARTQDRVALRHATPSSRKNTDVQISLKSAGELVDVNPRIRCAQSMKKQSRLKARKLIDVSEILCFHRASGVSYRLIVSRMRLRSS